MKTLWRQKSRYQSLALYQTNLNNSQNYQQRLFSTSSQSTNYQQSNQQKIISNWKFFALLAAPIVLGYGLQKKNSLAEEQQEKQQEVQQEVLNEEKKPQEPSDPLSETVMEDLTVENMREVLTNRENKFIYFYKSSAENIDFEEFKKVDEHASKMLNGMNVRPFKLDLEKDYESFASFLKERNPKMAEQVEEQIKTHKFLLANQYDDIWFWELDLINYFYGDLLEQIFNFYQGPLKLISEEQILMNQSGLNDLHIVSYIDDYSNLENMKLLKNFRKFHTKNTDKFFHFKYWITEDKELAEKLKISTNQERIGDVYLIRQSGIYNSNKKNTKICGYDYYSEKLLTKEDIQQDLAQSFGKIVEVAFNSPVVVHDYMAFAMLTQKFKTNVFVVYCDPKDKKTYDRILRTMIKARKGLPINVKPDENSGKLEKKQRNQDVIFVLSTVKNLIPLAKLKENKPQGLFISTEDNFVDLFNTYLPKLEKVEGLSKNDFMKRVFQIDSDFAYTNEDNDTQRNKKDTMKMVYSPDRFAMPKMYYLDDLSKLLDSEQLIQFVQRSVIEELPLYWEGDKIPKQYYTEKVVGEDFEKRIIESKKDAVVLIYHPIKEKNRGLIEDFEHFAKIESKNNKDLIIARYNGVNESQAFKSPQTLPAIILFKSKEGEGQKQKIELSGINDLLVKNRNQDEIAKRIREIISKN